MSLRQIPQIKADHRLNTAQYEIRPDALDKWDPGIQAAATDDPATISMYGEIGDSYDGNGWTAARVSGILRTVGANQPLTVNLNSPGGDFFEGVAILNLLTAHKGAVTVNVMGIAASAASVIAMAGDEINMGEGSFLMIHNAWSVAIGNRHDMQAAAQTLEPFDNAMASLYADRAGITTAQAAAMMDKETWLGAEAAVAKGFATGMLNSSQIKSTNASARKALATIEASMARAGYSRKTRRETLKALFEGSMPGAAEDETQTVITPSADNGSSEIAASLQSLLNTLQG
ncbi:Clp protease ClpP [Paraburkholderia sp. Ac-20340]|uniref:head maturation protease, ClpP-related n=1 Tax=Paraburkholderia sp. Ac-20340 TaxID=2703888 RepID=UPI00197D266E|nr:head maturation protease, ClpP-related [Paraburkholderia sp. Ac-20340]MBN3852806.1 Clp protease ClpP [Paraburkholderia sp. Ac-20340]